MSAFEDRHKKQAMGCKHGSHIKLVCAFDPDTFQEVRTRAVLEQTSVAEQVRKLVEWGLETDVPTKHWPGVFIADRKKARKG